MTLHTFAAHLLAQEARRNFHTFVAYVGRDNEGAPLDQRPLDHLLWRYVASVQRKGRLAGVMLPMGFGKTTQFCYRAAWELGRDPNRQICLVTDSLDNSRERVGLVRRILDRPEYRRVFPHLRVLPGQDERGRFTVARTGLSKDPSCRAEGVLSGTGVRTDFLLIDDAVTLKNAIQEPTSRGRVIEALRLTWMSRSQLAAQTPPQCAWIQTAYHDADAAALLREDPESGWDWLVVRAEEPYEVLGVEYWTRGVLRRTDTVASPFPAAAVRELARRMGPTAAARGLANRPVSGKESPFKREHFEGPLPGPAHAYRHRVLFADPAGDATKLKVGDPDYCAVVALGYHPTDRCWEVFYAERMRGSPSQQAAFIANAAVTCEVRTVWQEAVRDEALVELTQKVLRGRGEPIAVKGVKPTLNKEIRITQTLEPALAAAPPVLRVCGRRFPELAAEALSFPAAAHDDLLDALAGAYEQTRRVRRPLCNPREVLHEDDYKSDFDRHFEGYNLEKPDDW